MSKKHYLGVDDIRPIYGEGYSSLWSDCVNNLEGIRVRIGYREDYFPCAKYEVLYPDVCRKQAQDETWEFVKQCANMNATDQFECFGVCGIRAITAANPYREAKEKYDIWVKKNADEAVKEMTVEEISEALGYDVKIVKKKE